jgi:alpha-methylacyl-CoA racemase
VGAIEPQFHALFLESLGLADDPDMKAQMDRTQWPKLKEKVAARIKSKTRDEWAGIFEGTDACVAPVLTMSEAASHPHNVQRRTFVEVDGVVQPAPAPRFSRSATAVPQAPRHPGEDSREVLQELGFSANEIDELVRLGAVADA